MNTKRRVSKEEKTASLEAREVLTNTVVNRHIKPFSLYKLLRRRIDIFRQCHHMKNMSPFSAFLPRLDNKKNLTHISLVPIKIQDLTVPENCLPHFPPTVCAHNR